MLPENSSLWPAIATLFGAVIGATASIASTYWLHNKQVEGEERRLRQALIAEVDSMDVRVIERLAEQIQDLGGRDERKDVIGDEVERMFQQAGDEGALEAVPDGVMDGILDWGAHMFAQGPANTLNELSTIDLSTDVYDANLDKIGRLTVEDIEEIIEYYKRIHKIQQTVESITQALESAEQESDVSQYGGRLKSQANGLASQQERALDVLREDDEDRSIRDRLSSHSSSARDLIGSKLPSKE
ncbi:hypothetical protein AUR64_17415 [Haloprofundus marisrubri]|uniref:Uncharacterized protein n=1 Tax=Haloprofundus marisrubri TaxID=1514971 RepID=A0A0W1R4Y4_9EURY|nr:hypothetical protein [Haloprofundus marisrubri]KTG08462.1 hypothetical protein AUR64_17415 [Haloprofundus marisrubri]